MARSTHSSMAAAAAAAIPKARLLGEIRADLARLAVLARASREHADASREHAREALYAQTLADTEAHLDETARSDHQIQAIGMQVGALRMRIRAALRSLTAAAAAAAAAAAGVSLSSDEGGAQITGAHAELERHMDVQWAAEKEVERRVYSLPRLMQQKRDTMRSVVRLAGAPIGLALSAGLPTLRWTARQRVAHDTHMPLDEFMSLSLERKRALLAATYSAAAALAAAAPVHFPPYFIAGLLELAPSLFVDAADPAVVTLRRGLARLAAAQGSVGMLLEMIDVGLTREDVITQESRWAFIVACTGGFVDAAYLMYTRLGLTTADARINNNNALFGACMNGHLEVVRFLRVTCGLTRADALPHPDHNIEFSAHPPIVIAAMNGHLGVVRYLCLEYGITYADMRAPLRLFPLIAAVENAREEIARFLYLYYDVTREEVFATGVPSLIAWEFNYRAAHPAPQHIGGSTAAAATAAAAAAAAADMSQLRFESPTA